jgi:ribosomal protein L37AE/L43A
MMNLNQSQSQYAACPGCGQSTAEKVSFTLWGGVLGPKLFTHVKCGSCGNKYNGKTGKSNTTNILLYLTIPAIVLFVVFFAVFFFAALKH